MKKLIIEPKDFNEIYNCIFKIPYGVIKKKPKEYNPFIWELAKNGKHTQIPIEQLIWNLGIKGWGSFDKPLGVFSVIEILNDWDNPKWNNTHHKERIITYMIEINHPISLIYL